MSLYHLVIYVPLSHADVVRKALAESGAGNIGNYDSCSFSAKGIGRFRPLKGANPHLGSEGRIEEVEEERIEVVVEEKICVLFLLQSKGHIHTRNQRYICGRRRITYSISKQI